MKSSLSSVLLRDLLVTTKDGDWGRDTSAPGFKPFRVIRGTDFPAAQYGDISSIPRRYLSETSALRRTLEPDDILIETAGGSPSRPTGRTLLITNDLLSSLDAPATCASFARFLRVDPQKADARYVYWYLQLLYAIGRMEEHQVQHTGVARFQYTRFAATEVVPLPSLAEQRSIASMLGAIDARIKICKQQNRTLEAIARAIFKAWFVDFSPVKAKRAGHTGFRGMPQDVFDALPTELVSTAHGPIPATWSHQAINDLVEVLGGSTPSTRVPEFWEGGTNAFCTPKDMSRLDSFALLDTERHITMEGVDKISSRQLPAGTVLLSSRAPIGYLAIAQTPVSVNQGIIAMRTTSIPNTYVLFWAESQMEQIVARANGSTFAEISKGNFRSIPALCPDPTTLEAFGDIMRPIFAQVATNERRACTLSELRSALLPQLFSRQAQVPS